PGLPDAAASAADSRVNGFISESAEALTTLETDQKRTAAELKIVATGSAYDAVLASAAEFRENGWRQVGSPKVVSATVVEYESASTPKTMVVQACIDSSNVKVITDEGTSVRSGPNRHALNTLTLVQQEDRWLVESVGFPDNPRC
ncbi:hypothetical protein, partial [Arthrobacter sp. H14]|uniref:hypothetical protein n=1 Tax=Arthrobacter sp. H14 TaxID=1312959 RepID=UPI00056ACE13